MIIEKHLSASATASDEVITLMTGEFSYLFFQKTLFELMAITFWVLNTCKSQLTTLDFSASFICSSIFYAADHLQNKSLFIN